MRWLLTSQWIARGASSFGGCASESLGAGPGAAPEAEPEPQATRQLVGSRLVLRRLPVGTHLCFGRLADLDLPTEVKRKRGGDFASFRCLCLLARREAARFAAASWRRSVSAHSSSKDEAANNSTQTGLGRRGHGLSRNGGPSGLKHL